MNSAKRIALGILLILVSTLSLAQPKTPPLTNDDILQMTEGGLQESTIVSAIQASETNFDLSVQNLLSLRNAGVSDKVLDAMLEAQTAKKASSASQALENPSAVLPSSVPSPGAMPVGLSPQMMANLPPAARQQMMAAMSQMSRTGVMPGMNGLPGNVGGGSELLSAEQMPKVTLVNVADKKSMISSMAQIAASTTKGGYKTGSSAGSMLSSLASEGLSFAAIAGGPGAMMAAPALGMMTGMLGSHHSTPTTTYVWALPAHTSSVLMPTVTPKFDLEFAEIVGLDPDIYEPVIVSLKQSKDNYRLVGATRAKMDFMSSGNSESMIDEVRMPSKLTHTGRGKVQMEASSPLPAGEYGVVLRPVKKYKQKKGQSQSGAEQALFYSVWDFSIPAAPQQQVSASGK
jgi:hypothetical protein